MTTRSRSGRVGRPLTPVRQDHPKLAQLCEELRQLRVDSGAPKFDSMAKRAGVEKSTISRATSGRFPPLPSWSSIEAWIIGCGQDPLPWRERYDALAAELESEKTPTVIEGGVAAAATNRIEGGDLDASAASRPESRLQQLLAGCVIASLDLALTLRGKDSGHDAIVTDLRQPRQIAVSPGHKEVVADLRRLREKGLIRLRSVPLPALEQAARLAWPDAPEPSHILVERLLRIAVSALGTEEPGTATQYLFGLVQGTIGRSPTDLRERAAHEYGRISPETFRKGPERLLVDRTADEILRLTSGASSAPSAVGVDQTALGQAIIEQSVLERTAQSWNVVRDLKLAMDAALDRDRSLAQALHRALGIAFDIEATLETAVTTGGTNIPATRELAWRLACTLGQVQYRSGTYVLDLDLAHTLDHTLDRVPDLAHARDVARKIQAKA